MRASKSGSNRKVPSYRWMFLAALLGATPAAARTTEVPSSTDEARAITAMCLRTRSGERPVRAPQGVLSTDEARQLVGALQPRAESQWRPALPPARATSTDEARAPGNAPVAEEAPRTAAVVEACEGGTQAG